MIVGVNGRLSATGDDWIQLTLGGVTFQIFVPPADVPALGAVGDSVSLFTHLLIREEKPVLYGFASPAALELFQAVTGVSGVGPRLGLALLSGLGSAGLQQAIAAGDTARLSGVSGVGRRTADRIILELKGRMADVEVSAAEAEASGDGELIDVLASLGYTTPEIRRALASLERSPDLTLEDYLRQALQQLGGW